MTTERTPTAAVDREQIRRWKANLETEIEGIAIYRLLAEAEKDPERKSIFEQLAEVEVHHERVFREKLREAGVAVPERGPSLRARTIGLLARWFGVRSVLRIVRNMEAGEYVSMRAQRELFERQIELEREELGLNPEEERKELVLIYRAKGLSQEQAEDTATSLMADPNIALETLVREELGLDPAELGSPWGAAIGSCFAFAGGALVPVIPFLFAADASFGYVAGSAVLSAIATFAVGASPSLFTGRSALFSGARQVAIAAVAAALTFGIGVVIGVSTGI